MGMTTRTRAAVLIGTLLLASSALAACGDDDTQTATEDGIEDPSGAAGDEAADDATGDPGPSGTPGPAAGMCVEGVPDCVDTVVDPDGTVSSPSDGGAVDPPSPGDEEYPSEAARERARAQLGTAEADLEPDIRIGRRGDEQMMVTEDYVLGRITVQLDDDGTGTFIVTEATVELPDGPETFTLDRD